MSDKRIVELVEFAYREGIDLPMPAEEIIAHEDAGHAVDLLTGEVIKNGADDRIELTIIGEATCIVIDIEEAHYD